MTQETKASKLPAWAVGHDGDFDWHVVMAEDEQTAKLS